MHIYLQVTIVQSMCTQTILEPNYTLILEASFVNTSVDAQFILKTQLSQETKLSSRALTHFEAIVKVNI